MPLPKVGDLVAHKFRIEGTLGEGGMAHVLAAHHELLDKPVAVKILDPNVADPSMFSLLVDRFLAEARAAARVDSHHVARIMDVGTLDTGLPYIVMERLEGSDLEELLAMETTLRVEDAIDFILQALAGLAHAHALGIIHRDLKPANLFLAKQRDGGSIIKILDFGVAKLVDERNKGTLTLDGTAVGTPMYMAPEQIRTPTLVDTRVDIWAIGVVLYELLTGERPFGGEDITATFDAVLNREIPSVREQRPEVDEGLAAVIAKCLERDLSKRYRDVGTVAHALAPYGSGQWHALVEHIDATLHGRANVSSPQLTPTGVASSRRPEPSPRTETNIETPREPLGAVKKSSGIWRVLFLAAALAGVVIYGVKKHAFDSLTNAPPPPAIPSDTPSAVPSASASASASVAKSVVKPPPKPPTATTSVKKPPPKPTGTKKK